MQKWKITIQCDEIALKTINKWVVGGNYDAESGNPTNAIVAQGAYTQYRSLFITTATKNAFHYILFQLMFGFIFMVNCTNSI